MSLFLKVLDGELVEKQTKKGCEIFGEARTKGESQKPLPLHCSSDAKPRSFGRSILKQRDTSATFDF